MFTGKVNECRVMRVAYRPGFIYHRIYRGFIVFFLTSKRLNYKLRRLKTRIILFKNPHHFVYDEE